MRIATVDNFQGEEAKVVVVSLVRSNNERRCGFLKTSNRINVLLSRAKHGMYIIGNSETSRPVPMWAEVLSILERSGNLGTSLALCCPRHKETIIEVSVPDDFARFAPEGDVLEDAHQDYSVGMPVRTCAILNLCTMQFVVSNAAREPRKAASTNVRGRVGTRVKSIVKSWCTTSLYHVVILP